MNTKAKKNTVKKEAPAQQKTKAIKKTTTKKRAKLPKLNEKQIDFIENKIQELGSIEKVNEFYSLDDKVSRYAQIKAQMLWEEKQA